MSELKTLKDYFDTYGIRDNWCDENVWSVEKDLKAEAMKWVKECDCDALKQMDAIGKEFNWRQAFLNFHNLTEEDLK